LIWPAKATKSLRVCFVKGARDLAGKGFCLFSSIDGGKNELALHHTTPISYPFHNQLSIAINPCA
jgi:hypothetical protein